MLLFFCGEIRQNYIVGLIRSALFIPATAVQRTQLGTTNAVGILLAGKKVQCFPYFDGNISSFVFWWLWDYKRLCFCCFVQILSYDTVREGKAKLQIRPQWTKNKASRSKDLSIENKWHVHGHSKVFHVSRYRSKYTIFDHS